MDIATLLCISGASGLYTCLWGAFKDSPFEGFKARAFPRSMYFSVAICLALYSVPQLRDALLPLGWFQVFFLIMGLERFLAELYKGFFRSEDQTKYFVPSRITFFGRHVHSDLIRHAVGVVLVAIVFAVLLVPVPVQHFLLFAAIAYGTGLIVSLGGAYKDAPFEGFKPLKFQRSGLVLALMSPLLYWLNDGGHPVTVGLLVYMNGGLERFCVEYYKTYIQRNMSGKFRPDLPRQQEAAARREKFHYVALVIIFALVALYVVEYRDLGPDTEIDHGQSALLCVPAFLRYDALIIGSGFGAAAAAHRLVEAGLNTLMLERGHPAKRDAQDWDQRRILVDKRYRSPSPIRVRQYGKQDYATQYPNEVLGGMSVFYGGASLRLRERDFARWPIDYADLEPYYCKAEKGPAGARSTRSGSLRTATQSALSTRAARVRGPGSAHQRRWRATRLAALSDSPRYQFQ